MGSIIQTPESLAATLTALSRYRNLVNRMRIDVLNAGSTAVEHVSHAYDYASDAGAAGDMATTAQAIPMQRAVAEIAAHLELIHALLGVARTAVSKAADAMDEADARRKTARAKLGI